MANIMDYVAWRGDLSFLESPFNEVDNLILTQIAFIDFEGIVPEDQLISTVSEYSHEIGYVIIAVVVLALSYIIYKGVKKK